MLKPLNPFTYRKVALNLIYAAIPVGVEGATVMSNPNAHYDTERSAMRAGELFALRTWAPDMRSDIEHGWSPGLG